MSEYPIIFGFRDAVVGNGFVAGVHLDGRALMVNEDEQWWAYGVDPGGIAAWGNTPMEAYHAFRETVTKVLFDSAALTPDFESFKVDVERLCSQCDQTDAERWERARERIRAGQVITERELAELPLETRQVRCAVAVVRLDSLASTALTPGENRTPTLATAA